MKFQLQIICDSQDELNAVLAKLADSDTPAETKSTKRGRRAAKATDLDDDDDAAGPSIEEIRKRCQDAVDTHGGPKVRPLFKKFGATKLKDLDAKHYAAFIAELDKLEAEGDDDLV